MGSLRTRLRLSAVAVALLAATAGTAHAAGLDVLFLETENRTRAARQTSAVDTIVVHVTEGSFWGSVRWLRNRRSHGSSHYVVSRRGEVVQLVGISDVAWHAGNKRVNRRSIGIEHEGWTRRGGFTDAQYKASARLVAHLVRRTGLRVDRKHLIGHDEVPHPRGRGFGGINHHTDPGPHWDWRRYLRLVRHHVANPVSPRYVTRLPSMPPAPPLPPEPAPPRPSVVTPGARVQGVALWWSGIDAAKRWRRGIHRVDFFVDGRLLWTDRVWPFAFRGGAGWDTRTVANGRHMLGIRVHGRRGYRARRSIPVRVVNPPMRLIVGGVSEGAAVQGELALRIRTSERVGGVALYVEGAEVARDATAPYELQWDSRTAEEGPHDLTVYARARNGRRAARALRVVVANAEHVPASLWGPAVDHLAPVPQP